MKWQHTVTEREAGRHIRSLLEEILTHVPLKGIRRAIQRGQINVNTSRVASNYQVSPGDQIYIHIDTANKEVPEFEIPIVREDDHYAVLNKPAGINVSGGRGLTITDSLGYILRESAEADALLVCKAVHRLDKPTSGLLLIAKTRQALRALSKQFEDRSIEKTYTALVHNRISSNGKIDFSLSGKAALTYYNPETNFVSAGGDLTLVHLNPKTGRTHQLRKHMAFIGHPILGDIKYGDTKGKEQEGLMLCATKLVFSHPLLKTSVRCEIGLPEFFNRKIKACSPSA